MNKIDRDDETGEPDFDALMRDIGEMVEENRKAWDSESEEFWKDLKPEDRLKAFTAVTKRIHQGWCEGRSYRGVLYGVFQFGRDAYATGYASGFFDIYNTLPPKEFDLPKRTDDSVESDG